MPYGGTDLQITARQKSVLITLREEEEESVAFTPGENSHIMAPRENKSQCRSLFINTKE